MAASGFRVQLDVGPDMLTSATAAAVAAEMDSFKITMVVATMVRLRPGPGISLGCQ